jgi:hypothetical protein
MAEESLLRSWRHTPTRAAIEAFVESVTGGGAPGLVPVAELMYQYSVKHDWDTVFADAR